MQRRLERSTLSGGRVLPRATRAPKSLRCCEDGRRVKIKETTVFTSSSRRYSRRFRRARVEEGLEEALDRVLGDGELQGGQAELEVFFRFAFFLVLRVVFSFCVAEFFFLGSMKKKPVSSPGVGKTLPPKRAAEAAEVSLA